MIQFVQYPDRQQKFNLFAAMHEIYIKCMVERKLKTAYGFCSINRTKLKLILCGGVRTYKFAWKRKLEVQFISSALTTFTVHNRMTSNQCL